MGKNKIDCYLWRPIPLYPSYEISNNGMVRNLKTGYVLKLRSHENQGHLYFYPKRAKKCYTHRAVLEAFVSKCPDGLMCRHLDGNPKNNNVSNLKWGTGKENAQDAIKHGNRPSGEKAAFATMSNKQADDVRILSGIGMSSRSIANYFNVSHTTIQKIARNERYKQA